MKKILKPVGIGRIALIAAVVLFLAVNFNLATKSHSHSTWLSALPSAYAQPPEGVGSGNAQGYYLWSWIGTGYESGDHYYCKGVLYPQICDKWIGGFDCEDGGGDHAPYCNYLFEYYDNCNIDAGDPCGL